jgi:hypothetical protein
MATKMLGPAQILGWRNDIQLERNPIEKRRNRAYQSA